MNIDSTLLKEHITPDKMIDLMNELGATYVEDNHDKGHLIFDTICHNHSGQGSPKLYYYPEGQNFHCYTGCSHSFDIYELVSKVYKLRNVELHFSSIIDFVASKTGYQPPMGFGSAFQLPVEKETTGDLEWLNKVTARKKRELPELKTYSDEMLKVFTKWHHPMFLDDHILPSVMDYYNLGYHTNSERIAFTYRDYKSGEIIGFRGRTVRENEQNKYMPLQIQGKLYNFPSYATMYGLYQNAECIKRNRKIFIFEAEKSVLQCASYYGIDQNLSAAIMGKNWSSFHTEMLLELGVEEVILCFDKMYDKVNGDGWEEYVEICMKTAKKLTPYLRTYIAFDSEGLLDRDDSPSDKGIQILNKLLSQKQEVYTRSL